MTVLIVQHADVLTREERAQLRKKGTIIVALFQPVRKGVVHRDSILVFRENYKVSEFHKEIIGKLQNLFIQEGNNYWYLFENLLYAHAGEKIKHSLAIYEARYLIDFLEAIKQRYPRQKIQVRNNGHKWTRALDFLLTGKQAFTTTGVAKRWLLRSLLRTRIRLVRKLASMLRGKNGKRAAVIAVSSGRFKRASRYQNQFWGPLLTALEQRKLTTKLLEYDQLKQHTSWLPFLKRGEDAFIGDYYNATYRRTYRRSLKVIKRIRKRAAPALARLSYKGYKYGPLIKNQITLTLHTMAPHFADLLATGEAVLEKEQPRLVLVDQEEGGYGKAFMYAARKTGTKVVAFQYELVYENCLHAHLKTKRVTNKNAPNWRPVPDQKLVSGPFLKRILEQHCNYDPRSLSVVGTPRYDEYFRYAKKAKGKQQLRRKLGLPNKKILVYACGSMTQDRNCLAAVIDTVTKDPDAHLVVKIHPSINRARYEQAFDLSHPNITVKQHLDMKELLSVTDILMTICSTVSIEAVIFGAIPLLVNLDFDCPLPLKRFGVAVEVKKQAEIRPTITKLLTDKKAVQRLRRNRQRFLKQYLASTDGKSTERAAQEIAKLAK